jgi:FkbM family methyltransferase
MFNTQKVKDASLYERVFFDVGSNDGSTSVSIAQNDVNTVVFAFEPTPRLVNEVTAKTSHLRNYILIDKAVSDFNGKAKFNIAGNADWGCSSLLEFSDKSQTEWIGRTDFKVTEEVEVDVITLKDFIIENNIEKIDWIHIDTQGSDLNVLKGLGDKIDIVMGGVMEAANKEDILYYGQNTKDECISFLNDNGFVITEVSSNDRFDNEINICFARDVNYRWQ